MALAATDKFFILDERSHTCAHAAVSISRSVYFVCVCVSICLCVHQVKLHHGVCLCVCVHNQAAP